MNLATLKTFKSDLFLIAYKTLHDAHLCKTTKDEHIFTSLKLKCTNIGNKLPEQEPVSQIEFCDIIP